jgi:hypothetical protein
MTSGFLTNLQSGLRKPLCSTCFFAAVKQIAPSSAPQTQPALAPSAGWVREMEQLSLC